MWLVVSIESCFLGELLGGVAEDQEATLRMACCVSSAYNPQQLLQHAVYITVLQSTELHSAGPQNFNALHGLLCLLCLQAATVVLQCTHRTALDY